MPRGGPLGTFRRATMLVPSEFAGFELGVIICRAAASSVLFRRATMLTPSELSGFELGVKSCRAAPVETRAALETWELFRNTKRTSNEKVGPGHDNRAVKSVILTLDDVYAAFPSYNAYCTNDCLQSGVVGYGSYSYLDDFGWSTMAGAGTPGTHRNTKGSFSPFGGLHPNANTGPTENALDGSKGNGVCEDGGPGDETNFKERYGWPRCQYGSDCADCGPRPGPPSPPRSLASSDSPPPPLPLATAPPPASMPSASSPPAFASPPRADAKARCDAASLACAKAEADTLVSGLSRCSKTPTCTLRMADALTSAAAMAPSTASFPRRV